ncbi:TPA: hypothetical protein ACPJ1I_004595 [Vibrio diabolicus]
MIETFELWIRDSVNQSLLLSPLMGVVFGAIFTFLTRGNQQEGTHSVRETIVVIKEKIIVRNNSSINSGTSSDPWTLLFVLFFAVIMATYFYAIYVNEVIYYSYLVAFNLLAFGAASIFVSALQDKISSSEWVLYTVLPVIFIAGSLVLFDYASEGIIAGLKQRAQQEGAMKLYFEVLEETHKNWILSQLLGLVFSILYLLLSCILLLHNMSALQIRYGGFMQKIWVKIFIYTHRFSGWGALVFIFILGLVSLFALNGVGYEFLMSRSAS